MAKRLPPDKSKTKKEIPLPGAPTITGTLSSPQMGEQFMTVYHSSYHITPPHRTAPPREFEDNENSHPDFFHTGSQKSAIERAQDTFSSSNRQRRSFLHAYSIDLSKAHPVVYGDVEEHQDLDKVLKKKNILQSGLFEEIPLTSRTLESIKSPVGYRNAAEDVGHVSYVIPKRDVASRVMGTNDTGSVKYLGVQELQWPHDDD